MPDNVIFGTGPLGLAVARRLVVAGEGVRLVNRSGKARGPAGAEVAASDAADPAAARRVCEGAKTLFHCATHSYGQWDKVLPPIMSGIIEGATAAQATLATLGGRSQQVRPRVRQPAHYAPDRHRGDDLVPIRLVRL